MSVISQYFSCLRAYMNLIHMYTIAEDLGSGLDKTLVSIFSVFLCEFNKLLVDNTSIEISLFGHFRSVCETLLKIFYCIGELSKKFSS